MRLAGLIAAAQRRLRRDALLAAALLAAAAVPGGLVLAWLGGLIRPWSQPGTGPLLLDVAVLAAAAFIVIYGLRRWVRSLDEAAVAAEAERTTGMPAGTIRGVLELGRQVPPGTSPGLAARAERELASRLEGTPAAGLVGELGTRVRRRRRTAVGALSALVLATLALGFAAPDHSRAAWIPLAQPVRSLVPPPLPALQVLPGHTEVPRGSPLRVHVVAPGRPVVTVHWRSTGSAARHEVLPVTGDSATVDIPRIEAPTEYWVIAPDGAGTDRFRATPVDPLLVSRLSVDVVYPPYTRRPPERLQGDVASLDVPVGTQLIVAGRATRPLRTAVLGAATAGTAVTFLVDGTDFSGTFVPASSGIYTWELRDEDGRIPATAPTPLRIRVVPDGAPTVAIRAPGGDTIMDASLRQEILAEASDDYGVASAAVVSWRVDRRGRRHGESTSSIGLSGDTHARIRSLVDATVHGLLPGDTLKVQVRVTDASPAGQTGVSQVLSLWLPTMEELRQRSVRSADDLVADAEAAARDAVRIHEATRRLERTTASANARRRAARAAGAAGTAAEARLEAAEAARARQLVAEQEALVERLEAIRSTVDRLERQMERAGLHDTQLQERLAELRRMQEELMTPALREQLEQLRRALESLDPDSAEAALAALARQQELTREQLQRSLEALRTAAEEQRINGLAQEARELAAQQEALARAMEQGERPTPEQAEAQRELAERARRLAGEMEEVRESLRERGEQEAAGQAEAAAQDTREAGRQMAQAARHAAAGDDSAADAAQDAAERLEQAASALEEARNTLAEGRRQEAGETKRQAARDALALAERQQELLERLRDAGADSAGASQDSAGAAGDAAARGTRSRGSDDDWPQGQTLPRPPQPPRLPQPPQPQQGEPGRTPQQAGDPQGGQQQGGQQHGGQQQGAQQQGAQQQGQGQQAGSRGQQGQQASAGRQGRPGQQGEAGEQPGGQRAGAGSGPTDMAVLRTEQAALHQELQQLGRELREAAERTASLDREVAAALARANVSMQQTLEAMARGEGAAARAGQAVESLNRLALALENSANQLDGPGGSGAAEQAQPQLADLARQQGSLAGRSGSLEPMNLSSAALSQQLERLATEQLDLARQLAGLSPAERERLGGEAAAMAREAESIAAELAGGRLPADVVARQERLFHRLLDAGRTLEKDEVDETRTGERPGTYEIRSPQPLDARLFRDAARFREPAAAELHALPPAYRRLIQEYFERLNRPLPPAAAGGAR
jgi:hypothetical protein